MWSFVSCWSDYHFVLCFLDSCSVAGENAGCIMKLRHFLNRATASVQPVNPSASVELELHVSQGPNQEGQLNAIDNDSPSHNSQSSQSPEGSYKLWVTRISLIICCLIGAVLAQGGFADLRALYVLTASLAFIVLPLLLIFSKPGLKNTFIKALNALITILN